MVVNKQQVCGRLVLVVLPDWFLVRPGVSCRRRRCPLRPFVGLNRPFRPEDLFRRWPTSEVPGCQDTHTRVPSWRRIILALVFRGASCPRLRLLSFGLPCGGASSSRSRIPSSGTASGLCLSFCGGASSSRSSSHGRISTLRLGSPSPSPVNIVSISCSPFRGHALAMRSLFRGGASGLRSPFCGSASGGGSCTGLPSCSNLDFAPSHALHRGHQCLGLTSGGSLSLASGFDAGGSLGQGRCSTHDRQCFP